MSRNNVIVTNYGLSTAENGEQEGGDDTEVTKAEDLTISQGPVQTGPSAAYTFKSRTD
jgi:hypothetical protein